MFTLECEVFWILTTIKYISQDFKLFHSDVIISFGSASEIILFIELLLSLMRYFLQEGFKSLRTYIEENNSVADA